MHMTARVGFIPDILEEHLEELAFLWGQRQFALRSPDYTFRAFADLEERIQAHLAGVLVVGDESLPLLEEELSGDDSLLSFASGFALIHRRDASSNTAVIDAFRNSQGQRLEALRQALSHAPLDQVQLDVEGLYGSAAATTAVAAAEVLTFHNALRLAATDVERFLRDDGPEVRRGGWRLVGYLGLPMDPKAYAAAVRDDDPAVRGTALEAGAWCGEPGVLALGRKVAEEPTVDNLGALELLAALGGPGDQQLMTGIGGAHDLGPDRFRLLGAYGNPALMNLVLEGIIDPDDPASAMAAGAAFTKITGYDVESHDNRVTVPPADGSEPDEFEAEFLDEVFLPDPRKAWGYWEKVKDKLSGASRVCRGFDLAGGLNSEQFEQMDMESRWEVILRAKYSGVWDGSPLSMEVFPQRR
jgi:uncharacterized protein (TIGR02270 family)